VASLTEAVELDAAELSTRELNQRIKALAADGAREIHVRNPAARHSLCVALFSPVKVVLDGPAGWYAAGMLDGGDVEIHGACGWAVAENMMSGSVVVDGPAGSGAGATIRGGTLVLRGDAGARCGISMKGGTLLVGGNAGYMTGFMMQRGTLVVCGDAGEGLGDSMYEGEIFLGGSCPDYGADAVPEEPSSDELEQLAALLEPWGMAPRSGSWTKVRAGRKLWNFSKKDYDTWGSAL
jgi:glutamate synthase domain-containing protein 3